MEATAVNPYTLEYLAPLLLTMLTLVLAVGFVIWLSVFLLNLLIDTSRQGHRERGRALARQIGFGVTLLGVLIFLVAVQIGVYYRPYQPSALLPKHATHAETR